MQVQGLGIDEFRVEATEGERRALHIAKYMPQPQMRTFPKLIIRDRPEPGASGALAAAVALLPEFMVDRSEVTIVPSIPHLTGLSSSVMGPLWVDPPGSPILLPAQVADELSLRRSLGVELLLDPRSLPVPAVGDVLTRAAEAALGTAQPETLLRTALHWAFACEVRQSTWMEPHRTFHQHAMSVPRPNQHLMSQSAHRLIVPQTVRLTAVEAACSSHYADVAAAYNPTLLSPLEQGLVAEFFPSLISKRQPAHPEIRSALWILTADSPFEDIGNDGTSMLLATTFGRRSIGAPLESLRHWFELLSLPDDHPFGSWGPGQAPSDLRADLQTSTGVEMRFVALAVGWVLMTMCDAQSANNQLYTRSSLTQWAAPSLNTPDAESAVVFAIQNLTTTVEQMQSALRLDDAVSASDSSADTTDRRRRIEIQGIRHPFVEFDDGTVVPIVSMADAVHGAIELCQAAHNGQLETPPRRRQRLGEALGHLFEARVKGLCQDIGSGHWIIAGDAIDAVMDRVAGTSAKRADVILCNADGGYLVLEVTKRNLRPGIRYGDNDDLGSWVDDHLGKLEQARSTVEHITDIVADRGMPPPRVATCLVVGDLPLRQDVGLSALFAKRAGTRLPPFLCSIVELETLIDMGRRGWSVPSIVLAWQQNGHHESLGYYLSAHPGGVNPP